MSRKTVNNTIIVEQQSWHITIELGTSDGTIGIYGTSSFDTFRVSDCDVAELTKRCNLEELKEWCRTMFDLYYLTKSCGKNIVIEDIVTMTIAGPFTRSLS